MGWAHIKKQFEGEDSLKASNDAVHFDQKNIVNRHQMSSLNYLFQLSHKRRVGVDGGSPLLDQAEGLQEGAAAGGDEEGYDQCRGPALPRAAVHQHPAPPGLALLQEPGPLRHRPVYPLLGSVLQLEAPLHQAPGPLLPAHADAQVEAVADPVLSEQLLVPRRLLAAEVEPGQHLAHPGLLS